MAFELTSETPSHSFTFPYIYHVFMSFRGEDTRKTFTGHLHTALIQAGFRTFIDDDSLEKGENISSDIRKAISQSKCSIIIMSKGYSFSKWCLDELVMILEHRRRNKHVVLPIYYDVEPTQVRNQMGWLGEAFTRYKTEVECETDWNRRTELVNKIKQWKEALREVADLVGMVLKDQLNGQESKFIQKIVQLTREKLNQKVLNTATYLVGIQYRVRNINLWLQDQSTDVRILIISGIDGIGKTTIAKFVYNLNFERFEGSSFLANVREISMQPNGLVRLQKQLLSDILRMKPGKINNVDEGIIKIQDSLLSKRFLLVLDDVDRDDQLNAVFGMRNWFYPGSKIIITTRKDRLLKVNKACKVYKVQELDSKESLHLFSMHAFGQENPADDYLKLSQQIVNHCGGLPLALQTIGSSLSGKSSDAWKSALRKLELFPDTQIVNKLQISYDSLRDDHDKNLFLHTACFFIGKDKDFATSVLDACGFYTAIGIENLMDGYLLEIDKSNKLVMHQLLQDMAKDIVRKESPKEPEKRSRLWYHQDSFDVLREKSGTEAIEGLCLDMHVLQKKKSAEAVFNAKQKTDRKYQEVIDESMWQDHGSSSKRFHVGRILEHPASASSRGRNARILETSAFERMHKLRILLLNQVEFKGNFKRFPRGLRWLKWLRYPHKSIPREFPLGELVALDLRYSSLKNVFKGTKVLRSLKFLNLSHSHSLSRTPDFSLLPSLERLILEDCIRLTEIHESIGGLHNLVCMNLQDCKNLWKLPRNIGMLKSLETLIISGCTKVDNLLETLRKLEFLKVLHADGVGLNHMTSATGDVISWPAQIGCWTLNVNINQAVTWPSLPHFLVSLSLVDCDLSEIAFPGDFGNLNLLRNLNLSKNTIRCLPDCIRSLKSLKVLRLNSCARLKSLLRLPKLEKLFVGHCSMLQKITYISPDHHPQQIEHTACNQLSEIEGLIKLEPVSEMTDFWNIIDMKNVQVTIFYRPGVTMKKLPVQILDECGVVSAFILGKQIPDSISIRSTRISVSFQVNIHCNMRIKGINIYCAYTLTEEHKEVIYRQPFLFARIINKSKNLIWNYCPTCFGVPEDNEEMMWLSHWEVEDKMALEEKNTVQVEVAVRNVFKLKEFGIDIIYEQEQSKHMQHKHHSAWVTSGQYSVSRKALARDDIFLPIPELNCDSKIFQDIMKTAAEDQEIVSCYDNDASREDSEMVDLSHFIVP